MALITFDCPDELSAQIDAIVIQRKDTARTSETTVTPAQLQEAKVIARKQGIAAANAFLRSIQAMTKHTRKSVIVEALKAYINKGASK
jgi:hypothetical protein